MDIIQESYQRLFPEKEFFYLSELNYNRKLSSFNANIRFNKHKIALNLNLEWKNIDSEIKIGLIQSLLLKIFKEKKSTPNIELYHNFVKNIPLMTVSSSSDQKLEESFARVNQHFFFNQMAKPNLKWGQNSRRRLASYNFNQDEVTLSNLFKESKPEIIDYLMYHELLHRHQKFKYKNGRSFYHTRQFKEAENEYPDKKIVEEEINQIIRKQLVKKKKWNFW
jgi:predicted SprT family Zn-dependent metalloprotease